MKLMSVYLSKLYQVELGSLYSAAHGVFFSQQPSTPPFHYFSPQGQGLDSIHIATWAIAEKLIH